MAATWKTGSISGTTWLEKLICQKIMKITKKIDKY